MPLSGTRDYRTLLTEAPLMADFATEPWAIQGVGILQVMYELRDGAMQSLLPASLHPTIPPTIVFTVIRANDSSIGPFTLAEARIGCRAGARPRSFLARCYADTEKAATEFRTRWGYNARVADVRLRPGYDRTSATVKVNGTLALEIALINPEAISGSDVQWLPNVQLVRTVRDGAEVARIIQVDPDFSYTKADRGKPELQAFDASAWLLDGADPWWPVSASHVIADMQMPKLRYAMDPEKPAAAGVERL